MIDLIFVENGLRGVYKMNSSNYMGASTEMIHKDNSVSGIFYMEQSETEGDMGWALYVTLKAEGETEKEVAEKLDVLSKKLSIPGESIRDLDFEDIKHLNEIEGITVELKKRTGWSTLMEL